MTRVLIAGVSTRAAADSAARAGFAVTAIDGYADRDQPASVRALSLPRDFGVPFTARAAAAAAATLEADAVAYLSNFENDAEAVAMLAANRALWGNPPDVLRRARDPFVIAALFRDRGAATPRIGNGARAADDPDDRDGSCAWLIKPLSSGGGHGVRRWTPGGRVAPGCYLQERIDGTPGSIVFVAASGRAVPLGISRQLAGDPRFGARGFRYCGSILAPPADPQFANAEALLPGAVRLACAAAELGLAGVNGIDFVARGGVPYPIEINPRWSASMELVERATGINVFAAHADACAQGRLVPDVPRPAHAAGKAIVFARHPVVIGDTDGWLAAPDIRDVPRRGESIPAGGPVCTVFAEAAGAAACYTALVGRAERIYVDLDSWAVRTPTASHDSPRASTE